MLRQQARLKAYRKPLEPPKGWRYSQLGKHAIAADGAHHTQYHAKWPGKVKMQAMVGNSVEEMFPGKGAIIVRQNVVTGDVTASRSMSS